MIERGAVSEIRASAAAFESRLHQTFANLFGLRVVERFGWTRLLRVIITALWVLSVARVAVQIRPDLIHPGDIGSDSSNYVAAAERMASGHDLYGLQPGDRPVPLDNPPDWAASILSPPTIATAYLWTTALPDGIRLYPVWAVGLAATVALGLFVAATAPVPWLLIAAYQFPGLALTAWSGNVNAWIGPAIALTFAAVRSGSRRTQSIAAIVVALAACVKIGPAMIGVWILAQARRTPLVAMVAAGVVVVALTWLIGGTGAFADYFGVVRHASLSPSPLSIPGVAQRLGIGSPLAGLALPVTLAILAVLILRLGKRPESFALAVFGSVFATTVVRIDTVPVIVAAAAAWAGPSDLFARPGLDRRVDPSRAGVARLVTFAGIATACVAVIASFASGGLTRSSLAVVNATSQPVIARLSFVAQEASFGYAVPAGATVVGWATLGGSSPPLLTLWTPDCVLFDQVWMSSTGGVVRLAPSGIGIEGGPTPAGALAPYVPDCAPELKRWVAAQ